MKYRSKQAIKSMVKALERFGKCQSIHRIDNEDWEELTNLIMEKELPVTWNEILQFKEGLEEILEVI